MPVTDGQSADGVDHTVATPESLTPDEFCNLIDCLNYCEEKAVTDGEAIKIRDLRFKFHSAAEENDRSTHAEKERDQDV